MKERNNYKILTIISIVFFIIVYSFVTFFLCWKIIDVMNTKIEKNFFVKWLIEETKGPSSSRGVWLKFISRKLVNLEKHHPKIFFALECIFVILYIWLQFYYFKYSYKKGLKGETLIQRGKTSSQIVFHVFISLITFFAPFYLLGYYLGIRKGKNLFVYKLNILTSRLIYICT
ncbi:MAG: hypothetical protein U9532_02045 ['Conium maculatum' witches'-broom phytoplasma]|nr:hypothetical protein ['Conium maculatum' witches'-broom phytoplasma]